MKHLVVMVCASNALSTTPKVVRGNCWLDRPALEWESDSQGAALGTPHGSSSSTSSYLSSFVEEYRSRGCSHDSDDASIRYLSYLSLSVVTASLVHRLRREVYSKMASESEDDAVQNLLHSSTAFTGNQQPSPHVRSVAVAVAIHEGIWLPICLSVVHALNVPFGEPSAGSRSHNISAVLVPLDPTDATRRLEHMIQATRPALVITASSADTKLLRDFSKKSRVLDVDSVLLTQDPVLSNEEACHMVLNLVGSLGEADVIEQFSWHEWILQCEEALFHDHRSTQFALQSARNRISHVVFTSGTTGTPKGCVSSIQSLLHYLRVKNAAHHISSSSKVLLASSISFDPCLGDVLATFTARATLVIVRRCRLLDNLLLVLRSFSISHCLCTPTLWSTLSSARPSDVPDLRVVALGGEPIPLPIVRTWAREVDDDRPNRSIAGPSMLQLYATYGVTEACVYQTMGEVTLREVNRDWQDVGVAFEGLGFRICSEANQDSLVEALPNEEGRCVGEVVMFGTQLDEWSGYLNQPDISKSKFLRGDMSQVCYRTGDRGFIDHDTSRLCICGRIPGENGMLKVGGVRVEVGEMEAALIDDNADIQIVVDGIVSLSNENADRNVPVSTKDLIGYMVLSKECLAQLRVSATVPEIGALVSDGPLLTLIRERIRVKSRITPATFVVLPRIPMSATGKRFREGVPSLRKCVSFQSLTESGREGLAVPLREHSETGALLMEILVEHLNLLPVQEDLITSSATFATVGGDSLAATRVVRALYAFHHNVQDNRFLGGKYGQLESPFTVRELVSAKSLGSYVDWLDRQGMRSRCNGAYKRDATSPRNNQPSTGNPKSPSEDNNRSSKLYDALFQATALGWTNIAKGLLELGADPNYDAHTGRLSKVSGRRNRIAAFRSSPLHLACHQGNGVLVKSMLEHSARYNSPDPLGLFPIHLVAAGDTTQDLFISEKSDPERLACMKLLLKAGAPVPMKDGNAQTVLHCAARAGRCELLRFLMREWKVNVANDPRKANSFNWRDNWARTPVHWAVLNGKIDALEILLENGCSANPPKPKQIVRSSVANESPAEICERLHGSSELGERIMQLLNMYQVDAE